MKHNQITEGKPTISGAGRRFMSRLLLSVVLLKSFLVMSPAYALGVSAWTSIDLTVTGITGGHINFYTEEPMIPVGPGSSIYYGGPSVRTVSTNLPEDSFYLFDDGEGWYESDDLAGCGINPCSISEGWQWSATSISLPYLYNFGGSSTEGGYIQGQTTVVSVLTLENYSNQDWSVTFSYSGSNSVSAGGATWASASALVYMDTLTSGQHTLGSAILGDPTGPFSGMLTLNLPANTLETLTLTLDALVYAENMSEVPLPAALWLLGSGLLGLVGISRHRRTT